MSDPFEQDGLAFSGTGDEDGKSPSLPAFAQQVQGIVECIYPNRSGYLVHTEHPVAQLAHLDPVMPQCAQVGDPGTHSVEVF